MTQTYLILDGALIDDLAGHLAHLEPNETVHWLYQETAYADLFERGPALVPVAPFNALAQVFEQQWRHHAGLWLESDADEREVVGHLRSMVHARLEGDVTALFRFYDPRIARLWLSELGSAERDQLMGPIRSIRLSDSSGEEWRLTQVDRNQLSVPYAEPPWLTLSATLLEHLNQAKVIAFERQLLAHCRSYFPAALVGLNESMQQQWAMACREHAARHGYSAADEVMRWAGLYASYGEAFPDGPGQESYRQLLDATGVLPEQRLNALLAEWTQRLFEKKEEVA